MQTNKMPPRKMYFSTMKLHLLVICAILNKHGVVEIKMHFINTFRYELAICCEQMIFLKCILLFFYVVTIAYIYIT